MKAGGDFLRKKLKSCIPGLDRIKTKNKFLLFLLAATTFLAIVLNLIYISEKNKTNDQMLLVDLGSSRLVAKNRFNFAKPDAQPTIIKFEKYVPPPTTTSHQEYTIILVGDSMTKALGEHGEVLNKYLKEYYPTNTFGIFNYGFGATNILSLQERLENNTVDNGQEFEAILNREFEIIIIESFGHNPLSEFPLEEGKKKMNEALDKALVSITTQKPNSHVVFLATIPPNKLHYAENVVELSADTRWLWSEERISYILNHIDYANAHNIPVINVYEKSLDGTNGADLKYVDPQDFIHPSAAGVDLISREIANYIYQNNILPH
jgi:lysophospholipase L1-like esterase